MSREIMTRPLAAGFLCLLAAGFSGCSGSSTGDAASSPEGGTAVGGQSAMSGVVPQAVHPFDTIPLAKDTSYEVPPIPDGAEAGEVRELTALKIRFCWCPKGTFLMGSPADAPGSERNEQQFEVTLSEGFWLQQTELSQMQYESLMGVNPSCFKGQENPVESVSHTDATEFCRRLSELPLGEKLGECLPPADRSGMGVCLSCRFDIQLLFW